MFVQRYRLKSTLLSQQFWIQPVFVSTAKTIIIKYINGNNDNNNNDNILKVYIKYNNCNDDNNNNRNISKVYIKYIDGNNDNYNETIFKVYKVYQLQ